MRAAEMRELARTVHGDQAKEVMLRIAGHYDHLADREGYPRDRWGRFADRPQPPLPSPNAGTSANPSGTDRPTLMAPAAATSS